MVNVFTQPTNTFRRTIDDPSIAKSFIIALIVAVIYFFASQLFSGNSISAGYIALFTVVQWFVLAVLLFAFEIMFTENKKHHIKANFSATISVIGQLWGIMLVAGIIMILGILALWTTNIALIAIMAILLIIAGVLFVIHSFIAVRTILDTHNIRAFVAWILLLIVYSLVMALASIIAGFLFI